MEARIHFAPADSGLPDKGMWKCAPTFGDVNGDGWLDLAAIPRLGKGPVVWLNQEGNQWRAAAEGLGMVNSCGGGVALGDVNGDGHADLAAADHCDGVFVYLGDGTGRWQVVAQALHPEAQGQGEGKTNDERLGAEDLDLGDVNGDGHLDLVVGGSDEGGITVYQGDGTGSGWSKMESGLPEHGWANEILFADINADGMLDIVAAYCAGPRVWLGDGRGGWQEASVGLPAPVVQGLYRGLAVGDVNEDGRVDIAVANWVDGPEVYLQQADGSWRKLDRDVFPAMQGGGIGLAMGDLDGDGHVDLIVTGRMTHEVGRVYGVFVLRGDGRGGWVHEPDTRLPQDGLPATWGITLGDVDKDGLVDVAVGTGGVSGPTRSPAQKIIPSGMEVWRAQLRADRRPPS